eukprot:scaffold1351_cov176-Amphora_coffeaeformis.AAC.17
MGGVFGIPKFPHFSNPHPPKPRAVDKTKAPLSSTTAVFIGRRLLSYQTLQNNHIRIEIPVTESTAAVAADYEKILKDTLGKSGGYLDLAVLGFGPDGHTCSLFPDHPLLQESTQWVSPITDSPKPPPNRITLTFPVLNKFTRHAIVCGAGSSKGPILEKVMAAVSTDKDQDYTVAQGIRYRVKIERNPAPFPCAMVEPNESTDSSLTWVVDAEAMKASNVTFTSQM